MTIEQLVDGVERAYKAYQAAGTERTKSARYQRLLTCCTMLSTRLDEAADWLDEQWLSGEDNDDVWIDVLLKYEHGYETLRRAQTWL